MFPQFASKLCQCYIFCVNYLRLLSTIFFC